MLLHLKIVLNLLYRIGKKWRHCECLRAKVQISCKMPLFVPRGSAWAVSVGCCLPAVPLLVLVMQGRPTANAFCWLFKRKRGVLIELSLWQNLFRIKLQLSLMFLLNNWENVVLISWRFYPPLNQNWRMESSSGRCFQCQNVGTGFCSLP